MKGLACFSGTAVCLELPNIDTDQIIPARFLLRSRGAGYSDLLFRDSRFNSMGEKLPEHVLNLPEGRLASILVVNNNFGCGSAREQAAYALHDFGIRAIIAPSLGEIFRLNCIRNGVIPAVVSEAISVRLHEWLSEGAQVMCVDLARRLVITTDLQASFGIEDINADRLMEGRDEIEETFTLESKISAFEKKVF